MKKNINLDKITYYLISAWIALPLLVLFYQLIQILNGNYPTKEQILFWGYEEGKVLYRYTATTYIALFRIIGIVAIIYSLYLIYKKRDYFFKSNSKWIYILLALLVWSFICALKSDDLYLSFIGDYSLCDGYTSYLIYASMFILAYSIENEDLRIKLIYNFIYVISFLAVLVLIQNPHKIDFLDYLMPTYKSAIFNHYNHFAYLLCMAIVASFGLFLYDNNKITCLITYLICYITLLINNTFGSWLAVIFTMPIMFIIYTKLNQKIVKYIWNFVLFLGVLLILSFILSKPLRTKIFNLSGDVTSITSANEEQILALGTGRMRLWKDTLQKIKERPIFGFGPLGLFGENAITLEDSPHNEFLQICAFLGIPGLIMYVSTLISLFKNRLSIITKLPKSVLICMVVVMTYLVSSLFGNPVYNTYPYFWMFMGLASLNIKNNF